MGRKSFSRPKVESLTDWGYFRRRDFLIFLVPNRQVGYF
nr:MAG TPA: hypothetical protein [Caudoviricetes sp.]